MFRATAAKVAVFAFDATTNVPKTGDAANITAYISKDYGAVTVLTDTTATEMDATNAPGYYLFDVTGTEMTADCVIITAKSSTANIKVIGAPATIYTRPATGWLAPTTAGRTLDVSPTGEAGIDWANVGSPTTAVDLSGTTIKTTQKVDVDTIKTNPVVNGGTITFPTNATLASTTNVTSASGVTLAAATHTGAVIPTVTTVTNGVTVAAGGIGNGAHASAELNNIADAILDRNMATGTDSGSAVVRTVRQALRALRNKVDTGAGIVYKEDDATTSWSFTVTTAAGNPITVVDPA